MKKTDWNTGNITDWPIEMALHGSVHNELAPAKRADRRKFKNSKCTGERIRTSDWNTGEMTDWPMRKDYGLSRNVFTAPKVAKMLGFDHKTLHNWVNKVKIGHCRTPGRHLRFTSQQIADFCIEYHIEFPPEICK